jgi:biotin carboxyl carrier protein
MRRYTVTIDEQAYTIDVHQVAADRFEVTVGDATFEATIEEEGDLPGAAISPEIPLPDDEGRAELPPRAFAQPSPADVPRRSSAAALAPGAGSPAAPGGSRADVLAAPMPGVVLEVHVAPGAVLRRGDPILVLEAMKMRNTIRSPRDAVVVAVAVEAGQPVGPGDPLVRLGAAG